MAYNEEMWSQGKKSCRELYLDNVVEEN